MAEGVTDTAGGDLVRRIMAGDPQAEAALVEQYSRGVAVIVGRATGNAPIAEDLCQETFRLAIEKIRRGEVRQPERLSGFIIALARNLVIEHYRRAGREHRLEGLTSARPVADPSPTPADRLLRQEKAALVRRVLGEMASDRDRQILLRFYLAEENKESICADLGLSSLHFNRVLFRARERYRELYEKLIGKGG